MDTCYSFATQDQDKCMFGFPFFSIHTRMGLRCEARASPVNGASRLQVACKVIHATLQPRHPLIRLYIYANRSVICPKIVTTLSTGLDRSWAAGKKVSISWRHFWRTVICLSHRTRREGRGKKEQKTVQHVRTWDLGFVVWIGSQLEPKA